MDFLNKVKIIFFKKTTLYTLLVVAVWVGILLLLCKGNITNPGLWFDESGQFWIGKGLNHYSLPFSPEGGILRVLGNNAHFNLDPGGFSIIVHYWTMISNNIIFLKTLPFIFFVLSMIIVTLLARIWRPKNLLAYFGGFVLLTSPLIAQYAFEFRPYSMEMLTTIFALYLCYNITNILSNSRYALFSGVLLSILLTSRYSALFSIVSLCVLIFFTLIFKFFTKKNIINFVYFILPIIVISALIYIFTLRYQNPTGLPPSYVTELMFKTSSVSSILFNHQVFLTVLPLLIMILMYLLSLFSDYLKKIVEPYRLFIWFALLLNLIFIILSIFGKYPWGINSRWDISTHAIFTIAWLPVIFIITEILYYRDYLILKILRIVAVILFIFHYYNIAKDFKYTSLDSTYLSYVSNSIPGDSKILINTSASPTIRYLFEYQLKKNEDNMNIYKNITSFNHPGYSIDRSINTLKSIDDYNYVILTHFDYEHSEIKDILKNKSNWVNCSTGEFSKMFKNTNKK